MEIQNEHFPEMLNGGLYKSCFNRPSKSCQLKAETEGLITVVSGCIIVILQTDLTRAAGRDTRKEN